MNERSCEVETLHAVFRRNCVHLQKTNEPSLPSADVEVPKHFVPQSNQLQSPVPSKETTPAPSQEDALSSGSEVSPAAAQSPDKAVLRRSGPLNTIKCVIVEL